MEIKISEMKVEDLEIIKDSLEDEFDDFWNYNILKKELNIDYANYIVAKNEQDEIVGFAGVQFVLEQADITNIVTKKNLRNKGIGAKLLEELIKISNEKNMTSITLEVNENNLPARKLYEKMGFHEIGQRKKYYNGKNTAIIMEKSCQKG